MDEQNQREEILRYVKKVLNSFGNATSGSSVNRYDAVSVAEQRLENLRKRDTHELWRRVSREQMSRRQFLKVLGVGMAAGSAATMGAPQIFNRQLHQQLAPTGFVTEPSDAVNVATDEGISTDKGNANKVLSKYKGSGDTLFFPEGTYNLNGRFTIGSNDRVIGDNAKLVGGGLDGQGKNWEINGFVYDYRPLSANQAPELKPAGSDWAMKNILIRGEIPQSPSCYSNAQPGSSHELKNNRFWPRVSSGTGLIENVYVPDGSQEPSGYDGTRGIAAFDTIDKGAKLVVNGFWIEEMGNHTMYISENMGEIEIRNTFIRNSQTGMRIGGGTKIINTTVIKDGLSPATNYGGCGRVAGGIWTQKGTKSGGKDGDVLIENSTFYFTEPKGARPPITFQYPINGELHIKDCNIRNDTNGHAIQWEGNNFRITNTHIKGSSSGTQLVVNGTINGTPSGCVDTNGPVSNREKITNNMEKSGCQKIKALSPIPPPQQNTAPSPLDTSQTYDISSEERTSQRTDKITC